MNYTIKNCTCVILTSDLWEYRKSILIIAAKIHNCDLYSFR